MKECRRPSILLLQSPAAIKATRNISDLAAARSSIRQLLDPSPMHQTHLPYAVAAVSLRRKLGPLLTLEGDGWCCRCKYCRWLPPVVWERMRSKQHGLRYEYETPGRMLDSGVDLSVTPVQHWISKHLFILLRFGKGCLTFLS